MALKSILIRFGKFTFISLISYVFLRSFNHTINSDILAFELDKLSNEFEKICYSVETGLAEPGVPDTLKERARNKIDELRDALERNDYDSVKSDLSILKDIEIMIALAIEFAEFEKKKRDDYFFLESELIMLNEIDAMVTLAAEFGKVDKEKRDITE